MRNDLLVNIREGRQLTKKDKGKLIAMLSAPAIMAQISSVAMQYIDASMVGNLGANAGASIGLVSTTTWLMHGVATSIVMGFSIQVAQFIGAKKFENAKEVLKNSYLFTIILAGLFAVIGLLISYPLPIWLGGDEVIAVDARKYFMIYMGALPVSAINALAGSMLQCSGNMKVPGILNSLMCFMDVVFNYLFIYILDMGVTGAALGTVTAELLTAIMMMYFLVFRTPLLKYKWKLKIYFNREYILKAIRFALPIAIERGVVCGAMIVVTTFIAPLGVVSIAANSFAITAESLCYMPCYGIAEAATTLIGQSIGADRKELAYSFAKMITVAGMLLMTIIGVLMYIFAPILIGLLSSDANVCELGTRVLRIEAFAEPLYGASIVIVGILRGAGDTFMPSVLNFVSLWCIRIPASFLLVGKYGLVGIWVAMCAELCARGLLFLYRMIRKKWVYKNV